MLKNSSNDDFIKGRQILNQDNISNNLMGHIIDLSCSLNPYVMEVVLLSSGKLSDDNLSKIIMNENISDKVVENILKINSPINSKLLEFTQKFRSGISISTINTYSNKQIVIGLCCGQLIVGSTINIDKEGKLSHKISVTDNENISFVNSAAASDVNSLRVGGNGKWIRGELATSSSNSTLSVYTCVAPPNDKCIKVVK